MITSGLSFQRPGERVKAIATDVSKKTFWIYTDASIFELSVTEEDQDLWKVYLDKQAFDTALKFAKVRKHLYF